MKEFYCPDCDYVWFSEEENSECLACGNDGECEREIQE